MRAVIARAFGSFERLATEATPDPTPGPGEVIVDVRAAEVNYPDLLVIAGLYQFKPPLPFTPGKAAAGVICGLGEGVTGMRLGDRVLAYVEYGAFAERLRVAATSVFPLPPGLDFITAAALAITYQTAHFALLERARLQPGESVLVLGAAGGVGFASVQLAKALGAGLVIGGVRDAAGAALARRAGADVTVTILGDDLHERLREEVRRATGGRGADIVIDPIGGEANAPALRALAWRGRMVIVGFAAGDIPSIRANYLLVKNIEVSGLQWSDYRDQAPASVARAQEQIFALHAEGAIAPHIGRVFPLESFKDALALLQAGGARGRIILDFSELRPRESAC